MKIFKKMAAVVIAAVMALTTVQVSAFAAAATTAAAAETKNTIENGQTVTGVLSKDNKEVKYYFTPAANGIAVLDATVAASKYDVLLKTEKSSDLSLLGKKALLGKYNNGFIWNSNKQSGEATKCYHVKKDVTYTLVVKLLKDAEGSGEYSLSVRYPIGGYKVYAKDLSFNTTTKTDIDVKGEYEVFKLTVNENGKIDINITSKLAKNKISLHDKDGNTVLVNSAKADTGTMANGTHNSKYTNFSWNSSKGYSKGTVNYKVTPGDYYLKVENIVGNADEAGDVSFKATFTPEKVSTITGFSISLKKGTSVQLGAITAADGTDVVWSSSDSAIATVTDLGKVTAKKAGTAVITVKSGTSEMTITIIVK